MSFVRVLVSRVGPGVLAASRSGAASRVAASSTSAPLWRGYSSKAIETDEEFDQRWVNYFNREDIDAWELKKGLNDLYGHDLVPEPKIVSAMLRAARRLNDVAMAVRILEAVKEKAAGDQQIYSYILQEIKPTMEELGIATPEELGLA